ncbi:MAG TPA: hypothetical protein VG097_11295 [Gemmata sp.]|nr:hypothetical protein [Gemmata sp.]
MDQSTGLGEFEKEHWTFETAIVKRFQPFLCFGLKHATADDTFSGRGTIVFIPVEGCFLEHAHTPAPITTGTTRTDSPIARGIAGASIGLGFFSMIVFFWTPFSSFLSTVGLILGLLSLARGVRGYRGENFALAGTALCATSLSITVTLTQVLRYLQWDF